MSDAPTTPSPDAALRPTPLADAPQLRKALSATPRPPRPGAASQALAFGWRGMLKVKHVPEQLVDVTITPVMFVLMFTYLFGGAIEGSTGEYRDYILPGVLVVASARCRCGARPRSSERCSATAFATRSPGP
jgi:ABC-2 type transport system permease protein